MWHKNKEKSPKGCQCCLPLQGLDFPVTPCRRSAFTVTNYIYIMRWPHWCGSLPLIALALFH